MRAPHLLGAAALLIAVSACSGHDAPAAAPASTDVAPTSQQQPQPCRVTAKVDGVSYHERGVYGSYRLDRSHPLTGPLLLCRGGTPATATFYAVVDVPQKFAVGAEVDGEDLLFLADDLPPVPAGSPFAHILVGDRGDG